MDGMKEWPLEEGFGPGNGFPFGPGGFGPQRFFERGDLKFVILSLIKEQPRHGYDIIQELEKKFHGLYNPSAGTVYPVLQLLEDQDFVTIDQKDGKKVYSITPAGEKYLERIKRNWNEWSRVVSISVTFGPNKCMNYVRKCFKPCIQFLNWLLSGAFNDPGTMKELRSALAKFRADVEKIVSEQNRKKMLKKRNKIFLFYHRID